MPYCRTKSRSPTGLAIGRFPSSSSAVARARRQDATGRLNLHESTSDAGCQRNAPTTSVSASASVSPTKFNSVAPSRKRRELADERNKAGRVNQDLRCSVQVARVLIVHQAPGGRPV